MLVISNKRIEISRSSFGPCPGYGMNILSIESGFFRSHQHVLVVNIGVIDMIKKGMCLLRFIMTKPL